MVLPRGTMWRTDFAGAAEVLMIEATGDGYGLPDRGLAGPHAMFDPAILDTPVLDDAFRAQQTPDGREETWRVASSADAISTVTYPFNPLDAVGWHGDLAPVRLNVRDIRPLMSHRYHLPPSAPYHLRSPTASSSAPSCRGRSRPTPARSRCRSSTTTTTTTR